MSLDPGTYISGIRNLPTILDLFFFWGFLTDCAMGFMTIKPPFGRIFFGTFAFCIDQENPSFLASISFHQEFQVPKMEVLNLKCVVIIVSLC